MWTKPWTMKEGFLIGGGLVFVGLALQLSVGPVVWSAFAWPANGIVLAGFMAIIALVFILRNFQFSIFNLNTLSSSLARIRRRYRQWCMPWR